MKNSIRKLVLAAIAVCAIGVAAGETQAGGFQAQPCYGGSCIPGGHGGFGGGYGGWGGSHRWPSPWQQPYPGRGPTYPGCGGFGGYGGGYGWR